MPKFLFVCYNHGAGGESLAVKISRGNFFNTLAHDMMGDRTWTYDVFDKLLLKPFDSKWKSKIPNVSLTKKLDVIPSHYDPMVLQQMFPNELYVVINDPVTNSSKQEYQQGVYKKVWLSKHKTLQQKIGYWKTNTENSLTREKLIALSKDITNGGIECLIHDIPYTEANVKMLFKNKIRNLKNKFNYKDKDNLFVIEYKNLSKIKGLLARINTWLTNLEK
jgi:hypothetical protein